jgi:tRNA modification GTPase
MDLNNKPNINEEHIMISAKEGIGLLDIKNKILEFARVNELNQMDGNYLTNARQIGKLENALEAINDAIEASKLYLPVDMVELDIKKAWDLLGEIIGVSKGDELINELFSKFCLGK